MRAVSALFTAGLTLFLVRRLGAHDYGVYALALSVGGILLLPADFGVTRSAARFIAERRGNLAEIAGVLRHAMRMKAVGAGVVAVALIAAAGPIADAYGAPSLKTALWIVAVAIVVQGFMFFFNTTFEAIGRNSIGFRLTFAESTVEFCAALGLVLAGAGVNGALGGRAIGYSFGAALGAVLLLRIVGPHRRRAAADSGLDARRIARYAGTLFVIDAAFVAFGYIDVLMIGAFLDPDAAGFFNAPLQILALTEYVALALAAGVGPRLARGTAEEAPDTGAFLIAMRLVLGFQFMLVAPLVVWAPSIVNLALGPGYGASVDVLRALGPYVLLLGVGPLLALSVNYLGEARSRVPLAIGTVTLNAVIDVILIPRIGIVAGAIGTDVAFTFFVVGHVVIIRRLIDLPLRPLGISVARLSLAALAMAAVLFAFGTGKLGAAELIVGGILALVTYFAVLMATAELTPVHLRTALAYASNTFRRYQS
jgi:O-antigen/teichoic acid export membrane protein